MDAIAKWNEKNSEAITELRQFSKNSLMNRMHLSEADATIRAAQLSEFMTNGLKTQIESISGPELKEACGGQYAAKSLQSQMLDFAALLSNIRRANAKP